MRNLLGQEDQMFKVGKIVNNQNKLYKGRKNSKEYYLTRKKIVFFEQ